MATGAAASAGDWAALVQSLAATEKMAETASARAKVDGVAAARSGNAGASRLGPGVDGKAANGEVGTGRGNCLVFSSSTAPSLGESRSVRRFASAGSGGAGSMIAPTAW